MAATALSRLIVLSASTIFNVEISTLKVSPCIVFRIWKMAVKIVPFQILKGTFSVPASSLTDAMHMYSFADISVLCIISGLSSTLLC